MLGKWRGVGKGKICIESSSTYPASSYHDAGLIRTVVGIGLLWMNRVCPITKPQWIWFGIESAGLGFFLLGLIILHAVVFLLARGCFYYTPWPAFSLRVLPYGPLLPETMGACILFFMATYVGIVALFPDRQRELFIRRAPVVLGLIGLGYLVILLAAFLACFYPSTGPLAGDRDTHSALMQFTFSWHTLPKSIFSPSYWLIGSLLYTVIVALLCAFVILRRGRNAV